MSYDVEIDKTKVTKSFIWKFLEQSFSQGVSLLVQIVLARILIPEHFGSLAIMMAIISYANIFAQSGISTVIVQKKRLVKEDISTLFIFSVSIAILFVIVLFVAAPYIANYYKSPILCPALRVLSTMLVLNSLYSVQTGLLMREMRFKIIFARTSISVLLSGLIGITLALNDFGLWALVFYNLMNGIVVALFMFFDKSLRFPLFFSFQRLKQMFSFSSKIMMTYIVCGMHDFIRTLLIGRKYSTSDLAFYDKGLIYSNSVVKIVNQSMESVLLPTFSRRQDDIGALKNMARHSVSLTAFVVIPVLLSVSVMSKPLVLLVLSEKWLQCAPFLSIFCLLRIPGPITTIDKQVFYALGKTDINMFYEIGLLVFNLCVLFFMVRISVIAIAQGALIVELIGNFIIFLISSKTYGYNISERLEDLWKPVFNGCIMAFCIYCIQKVDINYIYILLLQVIIAFIVYIMMAKITGDKNLIYLEETVNKIRKRYV